MLMDMLEWRVAWKPVAKQNKIQLHEVGVRIAMGTDSGPPGRFQGYFEHMEMMEEVLVSATRHAAARILLVKNSIPNTTGITGKKSRVCLGCHKPRAVVKS